MSGLLEIKSLEMSFKKNIVLNGLSFAFDTGVYGLLGPNGSGKTTLMRCIMGVYRIKKGEILYNGKSAVDNKAFLANAGYLPQTFGAFKELTVFEFLQLMGNFKGIPKKECKNLISETLETVNLSDRVKSRISTLSGGMVRRLGIAQALLSNPEVIIFDEPTAGLDPEERLRFKNIIAEIKENKLIIISTHIVEDVEASCDKIAIMKSGNISVYGSCEDIKNIANGKVYILPEKEQSELKGEYHIQQRFEENGERYLRILSALPQSAQKALPKVEDGYICELKDI